MKPVILVGGTLATISGLSLIPSAVMFVGVLAIATALTLVIYANMDAENTIVEKTLYSMLLNVCIAVIIGVVLPTTVGIQTDGVIQIILIAGSFLGTLLGGILTEIYQPGARRK